METEEQPAPLDAHVPNLPLQKSEESKVGERSFKIHTVFVEALRTDADIIFLSCVFFFFFFPRRRRLDVYHTSTHGVALVRI